MKSSYSETTHRAVTFSAARATDISPHERRVLRVSRTDISKPKLGEYDRCARVLRFNQLRVTRPLITGATSNTWRSGGFVRGVVGVEPEHAGRVIIPERKRKYHSLIHSFTHMFQTTLALEIILVTEKVLDVPTKIIGYRIILLLQLWKFGNAVRDYFIALNIEPANLGELTRGGVVRGEKLSYDGKRLTRIDGLMSAVVIVVSESVRCKVTTIHVAISMVTIGAIVTTACSRADSVGIILAVMGGERLRHGIGLPNIHFRTAGSLAPGAGVFIVRRRLPVIDVGLSTNKLYITGALTIAVTSTEFSASLIAWVLRLPTVRVHLSKVDGTVETAREIADVDLEAEFLVLELEYSILVLSVHEIESRTNVGARNKPEREVITRGCDTVGACVVGALESTLGRTFFTVTCLADRLVPSVLGVAVLASIYVAQPSPIGVQRHRVLGSSALPALSTRGEVHGRLEFGLLGSGQLTPGECEEIDSDSGKKEIHVEKCKKIKKNFELAKVSKDGCDKVSLMN